MRTANEIRTPDNWLEVSRRATRARKSVTKLSHSLCVRNFATEFQFNFTGESKDLIARAFSTAEANSAPAINFGLISAFARRGSMSDKSLKTHSHVLRCVSQFEFEILTNNFHAQLPRKINVSRNMGERFN